MGLDLECGNISIRVGSYSTVHDVRKYLLETIINYIKFSNNFEDIIKEILLDEISNVFSNDKIDYEKFDGLLMAYELDGFNCFINHSDYNGMIESIEAKKFIDLCDKLNNYFDKNNIYYRNNKFYLYDIFKYSSQTGDDIYFC